MSDPTKRRQRRSSTQASLAEGLRAAYGPVLSEPVPAALDDAGREFADRLRAAMEQADPSPVAKSGGRKDLTVGSLEQRIRERAHRLWVEEGQPEGRADRHWATAAALVHDEDAAAGDETTPLGADPAATAAAVRTDQEEPAGD